eukprot:CAMPEP_0118885228 /NCGR_PEP_ID=MMETSP1163-20130328/23775_1 /TAXON_ID=124430 /ORGANISM="Phaeomonas parva, Strain CCMP2877" /LENGTH=50 /DNA_ID=CAMNT_0006823209 /DNA_START=377 /DNA_END=525 /DNA_ORIENTATION=-
MPPRKVTAIVKHLVNARKIPPALRVAQRHFPESYRPFMRELQRLTRDGAT